MSHSRTECVALEQRDRQERDDDRREACASRMRPYPRIAERPACDSASLQKCARVKRMPGNDSQRVMCIAYEIPEALRILRDGRFGKDRDAEQHRQPLDDAPRVAPRWNTANPFIDSSRAHPVSSALGERMNRLYRTVPSMSFAIRFLRGKSRRRQRVQSVRVGNRGARASCASDDLVRLAGRQVERDDGAGASGERRVRVQSELRRVSPQCDSVPYGVRRREMQIQLAGFIRDAGERGRAGIFDERLREDRRRIERVGIDP